MIFSILTLFPEMCEGPLTYSIVGRAVQRSLIRINFINIRDFATDKYKTVDDRPYGGGVGMILKVDVIDRALSHAKNLYPDVEPYIILTDPKGELFDQEKAREYTTRSHLIVICGHYEGIDARVNELVDEVISIGNFVLTGGEIPALAIVDSVTRLLPGVLKESATVTESFSKYSLEPPHYTRPPIYRGMKVPSVLMEGNHDKINQWKETRVRPLRKIKLSPDPKD